MKFDTVNLDISGSPSSFHPRRCSWSRARYRVSGASIVSHLDARVVLNLDLPWREARNGAERIENISRFCDVIARFSIFLFQQVYIHIFLTEKFRYRLVYKINRFSLCVKHIHVYIRIVRNSVLIVMFAIITLSVIHVVH